MKKKIISILMLMILFGAVVAPKAVYAEDELNVEVTERVEFATVAEFQAFLSENFKIEFAPAASGTVQGEIKAWTADTVYCYFGIHSSGLASKLGAKDVYLRHGDANSSVYVSQSLGEYSKTNDILYSFTLSVGNPVVNKRYQFKATYFAIIGGVEYTCPIESYWVTF